MSEQKYGKTRKVVATVWIIILAVCVIVGTTLFLTAVNALLR